MALELGLEGKPWYVGAIIGLVIAALVIFAANLWLFEPQRKDLTKLDTNLSDLQSKIQEGRAARQQLPRFREEVHELELQLEKLLRILPARRNTPELMRRIRDLTMQGNFDLERFTPGNFSDRGFYSEWPIAIRLEGTYHNLALFFDRISRFPRIVNIEGLKIEAVRRAEGDHTISANFRAKTFVYQEPEPLEGEAP